MFGPGMRRGDRAMPTDRPRLRSVLLAASALQAVMLCGPAAAQPAPNARPIGGVIVGGAATIARGATTTTIAQSSQRAAIDWTSFNVGSNQRVAFQQPSSSAVTLNHVTGPDPSAIAGRITANGQVVLTNQAGIVFYKGAQVDAQALVASAPGITTANFMAGRMVFDQAPKPGALISNAGSITVRQAGLAALVAPSVANSGFISAPLGHVVLAGAEAHTIDLYGDGLLSIDVTKQVLTAPRGAAALVTNTGVIVAEGGRVTLTAAAADGIVQTLVNAGGQIRAPSKGAQTGTIEIQGTGGSVIVTGQLVARGAAPGTSGGVVVVGATDQVTLAPTARINASGQTGGGTIAIGTTLARARGVATGYAGAAATTTVARGARVAANATKSGKGGTVAVLSTSRTTMAGRIAAKGGAASGDGGFVEISGDGGFHLTGPVDVSAAHGTTGTILLDPRNLTITTAGTDNNLLSGSDPNLAYNVPDTTTDVSITPNGLAQLNGTVHLQATNDLTVASSVALSPYQALNLEAGNNLTIKAAATVTGVLPITLTAASAGIPGFNASGVLSVLGSVSTGSTLTLGSQSGGIVLSGAITANTVVFNTTGAVTQPAGVVAATALGGSAGSLSLSQPNAVTGIVFAGLATTTGDLSITEAAGNSFTASGAMTAPDGRTITINADTILGAPVFNQVISPPPPITANLGTVVFAPVTAGRDVELIAAGDTPTAGRLSVGARLRSQVVAANLSIGSAQAGSIFVGPSGNGIAAPTATLGLFAGGAITQAAGLSASTLTANAASIALTNSNNFISTLGSVSASGAIAVSSLSGLLVTGPVVSTSSNVTLSGGFGSLALSGNVDGATVGLLAGLISQTAGSITATTLNAVAQGSEGGSDITLTQPLNAIVNLGSVNSTSGSVSVTDGQAMTVGGPVLSPFGTIALATVHGDLTLAGDVTAGTPTGGYDPVSLVSGDGRVVQTGGSISASPLTGSGTSASLGSLTNQVQALGNFTTTAGGISLTDAATLAVTGEVSVPSGQTIALTLDTFLDGGILLAPGGTIAFAPLTPGRPIEVYTGAAATPNTLAIGPGTLDGITAATLQLTTGGDIALGQAGDAVDLRPDVAVLSVAAGGVVSEGGTLAVGTLTGHAASASLPGANTIATLGAFQTISGFSLVDATDLAVTGPVVDTTLSVVLNVTGSLTLAGNISAPAVGLVATGAITQTGGMIAAVDLSGSGSTVALDSTTNSVTNLSGFTAASALSFTDSTDLAITGAIDPPDVTLSVAGNLQIASTVVGNTVSLAVTGAVTETPAGQLTAALLTGSAGQVTLDQTNAVAGLGAFASSTGFTLVDAIPLSVVGPLADGTAIALTSHGAMTLSGSLAAPAISLVALPAVVRRFAGPPSSGTITETAGAIDGAASVTLTATGAISQTGGTVAANVLSGSSGGTAQLTGAGNAVATLAGFSSVGGFALTDGQALGVTGPVADPTSITLAVAGPVTFAGTLATGVLTVTAAGPINQPSGAITADFLAGNAGLAAAFLASQNAIATLGSFTATGALTLGDSTALSVAGPVVAPSVTLLTTGAITLAGPVTTGIFAFDTHAGVTQTQGTLTAAHVTGAALGDVQFGLQESTAAIDSIGPLVTPGAIAVNDRTALALQSTLGAGSLAITAVGRLTLASDVIALTGQLPSALVVSPRDDGSGELLQTGFGVVSGVGTTLSMQAPSAITLAQLNAGLVDLVLSSPGGRLTGNLIAGSLQVQGSAGSANLFGTVAEIAGPAAAAVATIRPAVNVNYLLNGCVIATATCGTIVIPPTPPIPPQAPPILSTAAGIPANLILPAYFDNLPAPLTVPSIALLTLTLVRPFDQGDLLLPNISDRDY